MQRGRPEDRVLAATALRHFLLWLLPQLEDALANLQSLLADRNADSNPRQSKGQLLSLWVLDLFLTFCRETGAVTEHYRVEARIMSAKLWTPWQPPGAVSGPGRLPLSPRESLLVHLGGVSPWQIPNCLLPQPPGGRRLSGAG